MHSLILMAVVPLGWTILPTTDEAPAIQLHASQNQKAAQSRKDMILLWNAETLDAIREARTPPPAAARNLAIVHASIFDAVNAIGGTHAYYLTNIKPLPRSSTEPAAASAA